ncbi:GENE II AND X proteinS (plasmid) [Sinorhizobium fredii CCBAU 83666]|nr:GENE II AND X proteinS [Sinorhizobium fredii CCBAU 83666]
MRTRTLAAIVCGLIFGAGLAISDMINPGRVLVPRCRG